ncbi:MAG: SPOR domain-containing protein [Methyloceanibacter sp.]
MAAKDRRSGGRNWVPGLFAAFWILLAVFSGAYLFRIITEPQVNRADSAAANTAASSASSAEGGPVAAPPPGASAMSKDHAEALVQAKDAKDKEISELKAVVRDLSGQVADLSTRLKPLEKVLGPVAALPSSTAVTTSPPSPSPEPMKPAAKPPQPQSPPPTSAVTVDEPAAEDQKPVSPVKPAEKPAVEARATSRDEASSPPDADASGTPSEPVPSEAPRSGAPDNSTQTANLNPAPSIPPGTTRFGIEIGSVGKQDEIRPLWKNLLTNHAALVAGLQARRVMAPDKKWRLIAGPFSSAAEASQACGLFKKADMPCAATVFAGDAF